MNRRKTPLGDKFDEKEFQMLPEDWADMANKLAQQPLAQPFVSSKPPLSKFLIWSSNLLVVAATIWLWWGIGNNEIGTQKRVADKQENATQSADNQSFSTKKNQKNQNQNAAVSIQNKGADALDTDEKTPTELIAPTKSSEIKNSEPRLSDNNNDVESNTALTIASKSITKPTPSNFSSNRVVEKGVSQPLFSENTPPQYLADFSLKTPSENLNKVSENKENLKNSIGESSQNIDNQIVADKILRQNNEVITPLNLLLAQSVDSKNGDKQQDLPQFLSLKKQERQLIKSLAPGDKHFLSISAGKAIFGSLSYNDPSINRFRLAYQYRITPFLGAGIGASQSTYQNKDFIFSAEAEAFFHFIQVKKLDVALGTGYGYRQYRFLESIGYQPITGSGIVVSGNVDYRLASKWRVGLRIDTRSVNHGWEWGVQIGLTRSF